MGHSPFVTFLRAARRRRSYGRPSHAAHRGSRHFVLCACDVHRNDVAQTPAPRLSSADPQLPQPPRPPHVVGHAASDNGRLRRN